MQSEGQIHAQYNIKNPSGAMTSEPVWYSDSISKSVRKCEKMYNSWLKRKLGKDCDEYKEYCKYRNVLNRAKRFMKKLHFEKKIAEFKSETKTLWSILNTLIKKTSNVTVTNEMIINGVSTNCNKEIANAFVEYYSEIGIKLQNQRKT